MTTMGQKVKVQKTKGTCGCGREIKKSQCKNFKKHGNQVHVCYHCGLYNGPSIFIDYVDMPKQELIFGQPVKNKGKKYVL